MPGLLNILSISSSSPRCNNSSDILDKKVETHDTILDLIRNLFPDNIVEMTFREYETKLVPVYKYRLFYSNGTNKTVSNLPANFTGKAI